MNGPKAMKSCDLCRHRKKRCVRSDNSDRCKTCEYVNVKCVFSKKKQSEKRQRKSQNIAYRVVGDHQHHDYSNDTSNTSEANNCSRFYKTDGMFQSSAAIKMVFPETEQEQEDLEEGDDDHHHSPAKAIELYQRHIEPFTPYLSQEVLEVCSEKLARFIHICAGLSFKKGPTKQEDLKQQVIELTWQMDLDTALGIMILAFRIDLDPELIVSATSTILKYDASPEHHLGLNVRTGACVANIWVKMLYPNMLTIPYNWYIETLEAYSQIGDKETVGYQYTVMAQIVLQIIMAESEAKTPDWPVWVKIEQKLMNYPISLPALLIDLRDEMPSTPGALILHVFYNTAMLRYYMAVIKRAELGKQIMIRPAPSVVHFLIALALTNFRVSDHMIEKWWLVAECQAQTASMMLELLQISQSTNIKRLLGYWRFQPKFEDLYNSVHKQVGTGPWVTEQLDGYSVFWTFIDLRSISVEHLLES